MKVGIRLPQTGEHAKPENVIYLAEGGVTSLALIHCGF